jgi:hypothetical protein
MEKQTDEPKPRVWGIDDIPNNTLHKEHLERWAKNHPGLDIWPILNFLDDLKHWLK